MRVGAVDTEEGCRGLHCFQYSIGDAGGGLPRNLPRDRRSFNTPLEMRLAGKDNFAYQTLFQYSIGDAGVYIDGDPPAWQVAFNTPLEMPGAET